MARMNELEMLFSLFDTNHSGTIEANELFRMFDENGIFIDQEELHEIFNIADEEKRGRINLEQFKRFMTNSEAQMKFWEVAMWIRAKIEEDYQMHRVAER